MAKRKYKTDQAQPSSLKRRNLPWWLSGKLRLSRPVQIGTFLAVFLLSYTYIFDPKLDLNGDNAAYYILGQGIAKGKGYVEIHRPDEPPANHFPPGYPTVVAGISTVAPNSINAVKVANGLFFVIVVLLLFSIFNRLQDRWELAFVAAVMLIINAKLLRFATIMMSEIPFLLASSLALYFLMKITTDRGVFKNGYFYLMLVSLVGAYFIRTTGLAVAFGIMFYLLFVKYWRTLLATISGFTLLALPWFIRGHSLGGNPYLGSLLKVNPYRPELGQAGIIDLVIRVWNNVIRYTTKEIPGGTLSFLTTDYNSTGIGDWILGLILLALMGYGLYRLTAYRLLIAGYLLGSFGILLLWPDVWFGERFLLPVIPFLVLFLLLGLYHIITIGLKRLGVSGTLNPLLLLVVAVFFLGPLRQQHDRAKQSYPRNWGQYFAIARWVNANTSPETIISCRKPHLFYLFAQRKVSYFRNTLDNEELIADLAQKGVDYVVLEQLGYSSTVRYLYPAIRNHPDRFPVALHLTKPDTYLLKFIP